MLYYNSLTIIFIIILFFIPLLLFKGSNKYAKIIFYLALLSAILLRPIVDGIDNLNVIKVLTRDTDWDGGNFKFGLIYLLSSFIPGTGLKLAWLNLISTSLIFFSFEKYISKLEKFKVNKSFLFLNFHYFIIILTPLLLIHLRQFLSFGFFCVLIYFVDEEYKNSFIKKLISNNCSFYTYNFKSPCVYNPNSLLLSYKYLFQKRFNKY